MTRKTKRHIYKKFPSELFFKSHYLEGVDGAFVCDLEAGLDASKLDVDGEYIVYRPVHIVRVKHTTKVEVVEVLE